MVNTNIFYLLNSNCAPVFSLIRLIFFCVFADYGSEVKQNWPDVGSKFGGGANIQVDNGAAHFVALLGEGENRAALRSFTEIQSDFWCNPIA